MRVTWTAVIATLALSASAAATPLDTRVVPKQAAAVIHLDLDAIWKSRTFRKIKPEIEKAIRQEGDVPPELISLAMGAFEEADSVTVWLEGSGDAGAIAVRGLPGSELEALLELAPQHETKKIGGRLWHRLGGPGDRSYLVVQGDWIILSEKRAMAEKTLAALEGRAARVSKKRLGTRAPGSVLFFAVLGGDILDEVKKHASSTVLEGDLERARVVVGERGSRLYGMVEVVMADLKEAEKLQQVADGALALGALAAKDDVEVRELLEAVSFERAGKKLALKIELPVTKVFEILDSSW